MTHIETLADTFGLKTDTFQEACQRLEDLIYVAERNAYLAGAKAQMEIDVAIASEPISGFNASYSIAEKIQRRFELELEEGN
jgi:hypothetical protein